MFNPRLKIGQILKNADIVDTFKCGNMGGMRRSKTTNTLVIVSDYTKGIYHDKWIGGVLHYTGMGKNGDQDINWAQNATLAACGRNGVDVHLFEVMDAEYAKIMSAKKKSGGKSLTSVVPVIPKPEPKPVFVVPADVVGKKVKHSAFGVGTITAMEGTAIAVEFDKVGLKKMGYEFCMQKKMLEFI